MRRANEEITKRSKNLQSPRDIEDLYTYEFNFLTLVGRNLDVLNDEERAGYVALGFKFDELQRMREDQAIAKSWIDWYKHKRSQELESIKAIEDLIPTYSEFELCSIGHPGGGRRWAIFANIEIPAWRYRLRQAARYCRILYIIFCAPGPAPAPGDPLPADLPVPDFAAPIPLRFPHRDYVFAGNKSYGEECGRIMELFLTAAVRNGATSDLLPYVPRD